jgi:hypothetical protein
LALVTIAACLLQLGLLLYHPIAEWLKPAAEDSPNFQAALLLLNQNESEKAVRLLRKMKHQYPRSAVILFCLGAALDSDQGLIDEADWQFSALLEIPGGKKELIGWGRRHPESVRYLEQFGRKRLERARMCSGTAFESIFDADETAGKCPEGQLNLASQALQIAEAINPTSLNTQHFLAQIDEYHGDLASADRRLSNLIAPAVAGGIPEFGRQFLYRIGRSRNAVRWADRLLRKDRSAPGARKALECLQQAENDLGYCSAFLNRVYSVDQRDRENELRSVRAAALVTRSAVEIERGTLATAGAYLHRAERVVSDLAHYPGSMDPRPDYLELTRRLGELGSRLSRAEK